MTKITVLPEDTAPTSDDYTVSVDTTTGQTKKVSILNLFTAMYSAIWTYVKTQMPKTTDANGWTKKDYGNWQSYEKTFFVNNVNIPASTQVALFSSQAIPVGITNTGSLRFTMGFLGGFAGTMSFGLDNGNTSADQTLFSIMCHNTSGTGRNIYGYVYLRAESI